MVQSSTAPQTNTWNVDGSSTTSVSAFGAIADGVTDCTQAFQRALNVASTSSGDRTVLCPPGNFAFAGTLTVPPGVTLRGVDTGPPAMFFNNPPYGTLLSVTNGAGNANGTPFINLGYGSCLHGLAFYYPNQSLYATTPTAYPFTVACVSPQALPYGSYRGDFRITNLHFQNAYQAINLYDCAGFRLERITGNPLLTGIQIDQCFDTCWLNDIQFFPFWQEPIAQGLYGANANNVCTQPPALVWAQANGTAFKFLRSDDQRANHLFAFNYKRGFHFTKSPVDGLGTNGKFHGIRSETCLDCGMFLEYPSGDPSEGLSITALDMAAIPAGSNSVGLKVASTFTGGSVRISGGVANGQATCVPVQIAAGEIMMCNFTFLDSSTDYTMKVSGGNVNISNSIFLKTNKHIQYSAGAGIVMGCTACDPNTFAAGTLDTSLVAAVSKWP